MILVLVESRKSPEPVWRKIGELSRQQPPERC